jgi:quinol monooxygenase YgiN
MDRNGGLVFVVLYRWRTKPGTDERLRAAWLSATKKIMARHGALGSRLHRAEDGSWVAYAQWPDRGSWERMRASPPAAPEDFAVMSDIAADHGEFPFPYLTMELTDDAFISDVKGR